MKKTLIIFLFIFETAISQTICYFPVNTRDCQQCLTAYKAIKQIDKKLNPLLVFNNLDSETIHYFVKDYLKTDLPFIIDTILYKTLVDDYGQTLVTLKMNNIKKFQCLSKVLPENLHALNEFAMTGTSSFDPIILKTLNDSLKHKFYGAKSKFQIAEFLTIYSTLSNYILTCNLISKHIELYQFNDSDMYERIIGDGINVPTIKDKRNFYKVEVGEVVDEFILSSYCYFNEKLYLYVSIADYSRMLTREEVWANGYEVTMKGKYFILECTLKNRQLNIINKIEINRQDANREYDYDFIIINNKPNFFYSKERGSGKYNWYYNVIDKTWDNPYNFKRNELMYKKFNGNTLYNQLVYNRGNNTLIDNRSNNAFRFSNFGYDTMMYYDLKQVDTFAFLTLLDLISQKLIVYKVMPSTKKFSIVKTIEHLSQKNHFFFSYYDPTSKKLFIVGMKEPFESYLMGEISISD